MRLIGLLVSGSLAVVVVAEGAYIVHTRRQVARLSDRLDAIGSEAGDMLSAPDSRLLGRFQAPEDAPFEPRRPGRALPPPRLVTAPGSAPAPASASASADPLPLPPALDTPEAREQLRRFVLAQLELERQEGRQRQEQMRNEREQQQRERMAKELGLSPPETEKFNQIMSQIQNARSSLRDRIESGQVARENVGSELQSMRDESRRQMQALLGDDRMKKFEELRGPMGGGRGWGNGANGRMQGGGRRGWGEGPPPNRQPGTEGGGSPGAVPGP
jgi:DNA-binding transcriptional regulator YdaS (Cro superfamily)